MNFRIDIRHVQHVGNLQFGLDLSRNQITCVVGKNGVGKTTLIRAIRNLSVADTFIRTASRDIFREGSSITYTVGEETIRFDYDGQLRSLNCKAPIPEHIRTLCFAELPMPHGNRFNLFPTLGEIDQDIRRQIILEEFRRPDELIEFLSGIYNNNKFQALIEIEVRGRSYYGIPLPENRYVREDYLSSGEYFLINLYRTIRSGARLIAIDEIDLSLDAAAQVRLLERLRGFCERFRCNILFTTHSLAMMRTLSATELLYMDAQGDVVEFVPASYSYIRSLLFGFTGWDRYILTEDKVLHEFIEFIIHRYCKNVFYQYKIIYVAGGPQVCDLLRRNEREGFLSESENVVAILDGDQGNEPYAQHPMVLCLPIESVEKALHAYYQEAEFPHKLPNGRASGNARNLFHVLQHDGVMTRAQIYAYLCDRNEESLRPLVRFLERFLSR